jgi:hypothetical protein
MSDMDPEGAIEFGSVEDPGYLSQIPDPGSKIFRIPDPDPHQRIEVYLTRKIVSKLSEI